ncbi:MAG: hypothetical protein ACOX2F_07005 [bacterium]
MNKYYSQLKKIEDFHSLDRNQLIDYIHLQKAEASSIQSIPPEFWVVMDYIIHLTRAVLKKTKSEAEKDLKSIIKPLFNLYNVKIDQILRKMPTDEFFYLKQDIKSFHHIICHSINLIDKGLPHFIPSYLFIDSIEKMTVLYPLHENCCDQGTLVRGNYPVLLARYLSEKFAPDLAKIINFVIWLSHILPHAISEDKPYLKAKMVNMIEEFVAGSHQFKTSEEYSTKELVIELREVISASYIKESMISLLKKLKSDDSKISAAESLEHISSIFIDSSSLSSHKVVVRDLTVTIEICETLIDYAENGDIEREKLYETLTLARAVKHYFLKVTRYLLDDKTDLTLCKFFEVCDFLHTSYPLTSISDELVEILKTCHRTLETEKELVCSTNSVTVDSEAVELFKSKMKQTS